MASYGTLTQEYPITHQSQHRRRSIRLKDYDYTQGGAYFITIVTQNRKCLFGCVTDEKMQGNTWGNIVADCWRAIPEHFNNVELDEFIVMPNHVHGIIIKKARHAVPLRALSAQPESFSAPVNGSLSTIIRSFKSAATRTINKSFTTHIPIWQHNYWEHVIRNEDDLNLIREYIQTNPLKWEEDRENPLRRTGQLTPCK